MASHTDPRTRLARYARCKRSLRRPALRKARCFAPLTATAILHGNIKGRISDDVVARVVKKCAEAVELDASKYAGHILRAGLATSGALAGATLEDIMRQTRHKSERVARGYVRVADVFKNNVAARVGL